MRYGVKISSLGNDLTIGIDDERPNMLLSINDVTISLNWQGRQNLIRAMIMQNGDYFCQSGLFAKTHQSSFQLIQETEAQEGQPPKIAARFTADRAQIMKLGIELEKMLFKLVYKSPADLFYVVARRAEDQFRLLPISDYAMQFQSGTGHTVRPMPTITSGYSSVYGRPNDNVVLTVHFNPNHAMPLAQITYSNLPWAGYRFDWNTQVFEFSK